MNNMKTYQEVIQQEGRQALSQGFAGESPDPYPARVRLISKIYGWSESKVRKDIICARDGRATYLVVAGIDRGY